MLYMGIDPGQNGGIAVITETEGIAKLYPFSEEFLISISQSFSGKCVLEKVNAMPHQGVVSMFNFGMNYGFIQGVLKSCGIPFELVPPGKWKKEFSVTKDKNTSIEVAKRLFPGVNLKATSRCTKDHDGMAEALLMAEYARRHL